VARRGRLRPLKLTPGGSMKSAVAKTLNKRDYAGAA
jgi:hypothetical protein